MPDRPEEHVRRGGGTGELWGEKGIEVAAAAGQGGEVARDMAAVAGGALRNRTGDA